MKSRVVADATLYADIGEVAGWSIEGTGFTYLRAGGAAGAIVLAIDADTQPTGALPRNVDVPGGVYVDVSGTMITGILLFD